MPIDTFDGAQYQPLPAGRQGRQAEPFGLLRVLSLSKDIIPRALVRQAQDPERDRRTDRGVEGLILI